MLGEEGLGEPTEVGNSPIACVSPPTCELETVGRRLLGLLGGRRVMDVPFASRVGVILCLGPVSDDEELNVLEESGSSPEAVALVAIYLVKGFADGDASAFEFNVDERESVHQDGYVVAVGSRSVYFILVDDLKAIVMNVLLVQEANVLRRPVISHQDLGWVILNSFGFFENAIVRG